MELDFNQGDFRTNEILVMRVWKRVTGGEFHRSICGGMMTEAPPRS